MPPKPKVTRDMIVKAAFELVKTGGPEKITAQAVARMLGCSTQPVMYHFKKVEDLRTAAAEEADRYHSAYLMDIPGENPTLEIGLKYIRFAHEEKNLFRLLFQSGSFSGTSLRESIQSPELQPVLEIFSRQAGITLTDAERAFKALFLVVHGWASMLASNELTYDEQEITEDLTLIFEGTVCSLKERNGNG